MTKEEYIYAVKMDKQLSAIEKQVKKSRARLKDKINSYVPKEQKKLIGGL